MVTQKKKSTKRTAKPKTKVVYRTKKVYVERKDHDDENPFKGVNQMIGTGMGAVIGISMAGAVAKGLNNL